jgi:hypothetical protein
MSNLNAETINVTNLNVAYINGVPYSSIIASTTSSTGGYYVPCPDCNYQGSEECDCGVSCNYVEYVPDVCDCYVEPIPISSGTGPTGPVGPTGAGKTFVINHPDNNERYLIHACLEGPENGVYYRGKNRITNNESVRIFLPNYVKKIAFDFTAIVTPIYSDTNLTKPLQVSEIEDNSFVVYGENTKFNWLVYGSRGSLDVEPLKSSVDVKGIGPYKWI